MRKPHGTEKVVPWGKYLIFYSERRIFRMFTHICLNDSLPLIIRYMYPKSRIDKARFPGKRENRGNLAYHVA
jgi:hypothetical protein